MKFPFGAYLKSLGMGRLLIQRLTRVHDFYVAVLPEKIDKMFVCDYVNEDGTRAYLSAWFFTESYSVEARNWETEDDWDALRIARVQYWRLYKQDYEFDEPATDKARLRIEFASATNTGQLAATGHNCDSLRDIFLERLNPRLGEA